MVVVSVMMIPQARCSLPSNFDCDYAYSLGRVAALLSQGGYTGYAACVTRLHHRPEEWQVCCQWCCWLAHHVGDACLSCD